MLGDCDGDPDLRRCSVTVKKNGWRCANVFSVSMDGNFKLCPHHRKKKRAYQKLPHMKASHSKAMKKFVATGKSAKCKRKWRKQDSVKEKERAYNALPKERERKRKWKHTPEGKACSLKSSRRYGSRLSSSLRKMVNGTHRNPITFKKLGIFKDNDDARDHFASTFQPWMSHSNYGAYSVGDEYSTKWQIGHRLPKIAYDHSNPADVKRAWSRDNLFAQCAKENNELGAKSAVNDDELVRLQHIWPLAAGNSFSKLKLILSGVH